MIISLILKKMPVLGITLKTYSVCLIVKGSKDEAVVCRPYSAKTEAAYEVYYRLVK